MRAAGQGGVVACSALRRAYRDVLIGDRSGVALVYLRGDHDVLAARMRSRPGHFMPVSLLDSQLATLEEPGADERPIVLPINGTPAGTVRAIVAALEGR
jgi:carbohydrate kinase (thermoresistant glucokinase family)